MVYTEQNLVRIAKRENNPKRNYLVVNRLQGKHIPAAPREALAMFRALADRLRDIYVPPNVEEVCSRSSAWGNSLLVIGFAETATAIGAAVAAELGAGYIQTTRELVPDAEYLYFSEEHSHATEQKLVKNDMDMVVSTIDRILFVEDEVTTGKTILNIIAILKKQYPKDIKFSVASILNGMDQAALDTYKDNGIELFWLVKTQHAAYSKMAASYKGDGVYVDCRSNAAGSFDVADTMKFVRAVMDGRKALMTKDASVWEYAKQLSLKMINTADIIKPMNTRRIVNAVSYQQYCASLCQNVASQLDLNDAQNILVLGTEEYMYPALYTAAKLEMQGKKVWFHATTRSPIAVSTESNYPFHTRYELVSFYDSKRDIYVYDLQKYDTVVIMTDAQGEMTEGICSLLQALISSGNERIVFVFS